MIDTGTGPTLVLVHGVGDSAAGWADFVEAMSPDFRVIACDQRGHGDGPRFLLPLEAPFEVLIDDLLDLLSAQPAPVHLVGHSMGGAVAAEATVRRPELVRSLILEDPAWRDLTPEMRELIGEVRVLSKQQNLEDMDAAMATKRAEGWSERETRAWAAAHHQTQREFLATGIVSQDRPWREVQADLLASGVPVLVLVGDGRGVVVDKRELELDHREFHAGHCIRREQPGAYEEAVRGFIALTG